MAKGAPEIHENAPGNLIYDWELGVDPSELRRQNFVKSFPHQTPVIMTYDSGDFAANLDQAETAADVPFYSVHHHSTECPGNPLEMKGCGEAGAIGSPSAVINAITDAIDTKNLSMPATPAKVCAALQEASAPQAAE